MLRDTHGPVTPPYTQELEARSVQAEAITKRFGVPEATSMVHHPSADLVLVPSRDRLALGDTTTGRVLVRLEGSRDVATSAVRFSPDGTYVVGALEGARRALVVWDPSTGARIFAQ